MTAIGLIAGVITAAPAPAQTPAPSASGLALTRPVTGITKVTAKKITVPNPAGRNVVPAPVTWPAASTGTITLAVRQANASTATPAAGVKTHASGMPVWAQSVPAQPSNSPAAKASVASGPQGVAVTVADRQAAAKSGVDGVILSAHATAGGSGSARIGLDYGGFAGAFGGNYATRLHMVTLPACALVTPQVAACRTQTPLVSTNSATDKSVSAVVTLPAATAVSNGNHADTSETSPPVVLAATAGTTSTLGGGTYSATSLKPSGSWTAGGSSGSFTYSYPISVPPAASKLVPSVALSYDSGSVDGQTASTQAQSSWIGDGWSGPESYIEQSFIPCSDSPEGSAAPSSTADQCYDGSILSLSLNGSTTPLVVLNADNHTYRPAQDNGETVIYTVPLNGDGAGTNDDGYWRVIERDGTEFDFGRNELPGWATGKPATNSVDSEPVYSAHAGDPCYNAAGFGSSVCTMAYRWNLDYVTDVHGNAMAYYYQQDTNYYGENNGAKNVSYVRDSHLDHIDYGFTDKNAYTASAPDEVRFGTGDRCVDAPCDPLNASTAGHWDDVPYDLNCAAGTTCSMHAPSHWSTVALSQISTWQYNAATSAYQPVDSWALTHTMPPTGDGTTTATLWLASIQHTGADTSGGGSATPITLPAVSFAGIQMQNRVDTASDPTTNELVALYRYRISMVTSETGAQTGVTYSPASDCPTPVTLAPATNTARCYPMSWVPSDYEKPIIDWFHKYVVESVSQHDSTGGMPDMLTSYTYSAAGGAWHYDDNEVVKPQYRTYGQWRGYGEVQTRTGETGDPQTLTDTTYYRGMDGDTLPNNATRSVTLTDSQGGQHTDTNALAGTVLETTAYLGDGGPVDHSTINSYWVSAPTASRARTGLPALTANLVGQVETWSRQAITDGGTTSWRDTETDNSYDPATGLVTYTDTHGDLAHPEQATCTATSYAPANAGLNLVGLPAEVEVDAGNCGGANPSGASAPTVSQINTLTASPSLSRPGDVISDTRTVYDNPTLAQQRPQGSVTWPQAVPTLGDASVVQDANGYSNGAFTYQTSKSSVYDSYGRPTITYDANGNQTTTDYTMNGGVTTSTTITNPLNQKTVATLDPARGIPTGGTDPNGITSVQQYDTLGRLTSVWTSSRPTTSPANITYNYQVSNTAPTVVTTTTLNDESGHYSSTAIYDSLLRPVQTQTPTPQGGRLVTNTIYDSHGWVVTKNNPYWDNSATPGSDLISAADNLLPNQDRLTLDGLGRTVVDKSTKYSQVISTTTTVYNGDRTTVIPPTGGVTSDTATDALGRTTATDQYTAAPTLHTPATPFTGFYSVTGGTSQATTTSYNHQGRPATLTDPAGNTWTTSYNLLGQATAKTDPDTGSSTTSYDPNGNVTSTTDADGHTLSYTYDHLNRKTAEYDGPTTTSPMLASWTYDGTGATLPNSSSPLPDAIGQLTSESSYVTSGGHTYAYTEANTTGFNVFGKSLDTTITIPANEGALAGTYKFTHRYSPTLGLPAVDIYPAIGSLPLEDVGYGYGSPMDLLASVASNVNYGTSTSFDAYSRPIGEELNGGTNISHLYTSYDIHTGKVTNVQLNNNAASSPTVDSTSYGYDPAGNISSETDQRNADPGTTETQCYAYDALDRLHQAWTATDSCSADPATNSGATVGDPINGGAYWSSWSFDPLGDRTSETDHALPGATGGDTTTTYTYPTAGASQPHALASTSTTGPGGSSSASYGYDPSGNTTQRTLPGATQNLTWTDTDKLATVTSPAGATAYTYDADGNELLRHDPGLTTLFLPNEEIALNTATNAITGTRFYLLPGGGEAIRTGSGTRYGYELTDQHGTATVALDNTAQVATWRQSTPYGGPRGTTPNTWPDQHGFLNKPADSSTDLTDVGARAYDPATGRFISVDPQLDPNNPQSMTGYAYADGNPTTQADPTGMCATMDGPSGKPVCAPACVLAGTCSLPEPAQVGATTPPGDDTAAPASSPLGRSVLGKSPNKGQLTYMRHLGYRGTDEFTWAEALDWLSQSGPYQNGAWDMFCQTFEHQSVSACASNPFNGDPDINNPWNTVTPAGGGIDWSHVVDALPLLAAALALAPVVEGVGIGAGLAAAGGEALGDAAGDAGAAAAEGGSAASRVASAASRVTSDVRAAGGKAVVAGKRVLSAAQGVYLRVIPYISKCVTAGLTSYNDFSRGISVLPPINAVAVGVYACVNEFLSSGSNEFDQFLGP